MSNNALSPLRMQHVSLDCICCNVWYLFMIKQNDKDATDYINNGVDGDGGAGGGGGEEVNDLCGGADDLRLWLNLTHDDLCSYDDPLPGVTTIFLKH